MPIINNLNVKGYIDKLLIDPYNIKIDLNVNKTANDNTHRWVTLADAIKGGYKFNFDYDIKLPTAKYLPEVTVTSSPKMYSVGGGEARPFNSFEKAILYAQEHPKTDPSENVLNWLLAGTIAAPLATATISAGYAGDRLFHDAVLSYNGEDIDKNGMWVYNPGGWIAGSIPFKVPQAIKGLLNSVSSIYKRFSPHFTKDNVQALSDLSYYIRKGLNKKYFSINPETDLVIWSSKVPEENVSFISESLKREHPQRRSTFYIETNQGKLGFNPEVGYTLYHSKFPNFGEASIISDNNKGIVSRMVLTSPRVDQGGTNLSLPDILPKDIVKDFWINARRITKPGTYISGDLAAHPLGLQVIQTYKNLGLLSAIKEAIQPIKYRPTTRLGLSPDSYSSIIRQALRKGSRLRWGAGFYDWNPSAVENKYISDAFNQYKNGNISLLEYEKIFNDWAIPLGGRPLLFQTYNNNIIPIHPHPYIFIKRKGGKLNEKD